MMNGSLVNKGIFSAVGVHPMTSREAHPRSRSTATGRRIVGVAIGQRFYPAGLEYIGDLHAWCVHWERASQYS